MLKGKAADKKTELQTKRQTTYEAARFVDFRKKMMI